MTASEGRVPAEVWKRPASTLGRYFVAVLTHPRPGVRLAGYGALTGFVILVGSVIWLGVAAIRTSERPSTRVQQLTKRIDQNPKDPRARVELGFLYESEGRLDLALKQYNGALALQPRNTAALYNRGRIYLISGLDDKAEEAFWDVLEVDPDHVQASIFLGKIYVKRNQFRSLDVAVRPVADRNPHVAQLQYLAGLAAERAGNGGEAVIRYKRALLDDPDLVEARDGLDRLGVVPE